MCGRYSLYSTGKVKKIFGIDIVPDYNISPGNKVIIIDDQVLINEYYKNTKPHLNQEEINFLIEDQFKYDEEIDEPRDIKKKKLAFKEEVAKARKELDVMKDKYYQEIKLRPGITQDQQKAVDFFNRYKEQEEQSITLQEDFKNKTEQIFTDDFKGFNWSAWRKYWY